MPAREVWVADREEGMTQTPPQLPENLFSLGKKIFQSNDMRSA
jgi:hypothetical protein